MFFLPCLSLIFLAGGTYASYRDFEIPSSTATVEVSAFHVGNATFIGDTHTIVLPVLPGRESVTFPLFAFLVEHTKTKKRVMFDLGMRKDPLNFAPSIASGFTSGAFILDESKDITEMLEAGGIALSSIETVIWR